MPTTLTQNENEPVADNPSLEAVGGRDAEQTTTPVIYPHTQADYQPDSYAEIQQYNYRISLENDYGVLPDHQFNAILGDYDKGINELFTSVGDNHDFIQLQDIYDRHNESAVRVAIWNSLSEDMQVQINQRSMTFDTDPQIKAFLNKNQPITQEALDDYRQRTGIDIDKIAVDSNYNQQASHSFSDDYRSTEGVRQDISDEELLEIEANMIEQVKKDFAEMRVAYTNEDIQSIVGNAFGKEVANYLVQRDRYNTILDSKEYETVAKAFDYATRQNSYQGVPLSGRTDVENREMAETTLSITAHSALHSLVYQNIQNDPSFSQSDVLEQGRLVANTMSQRISTNFGDRQAIEFKKAFEDSIAGREIPEPPTLIEKLVNDYRAKTDKSQAIDDEKIADIAQDVINFARRDLREVNKSTSDKSVAELIEHYGYFDDAVEQHIAERDLAPMKQEQDYFTINEALVKSAKQSEVMSDYLLNEITQRFDQKLREAILSGKSGDKDVYLKSGEAVINDLRNILSDKDKNAAMAYYFQESVQDHRQTLENAGQGQVKDGINANTQTGLQALKNVIDTMPEGEKKQQALERFNQLQPTTEQQQAVPSFVSQPQTGVVQKGTENSKEIGY